MISGSAVKKIGDFPQDSSGGRDAAPDNSRCCEIRATVFAAMKRFYRIIKAHARRASDYAVETRQVFSCRRGMHFAQSFIWGMRTEIKLFVSETVVEKQIEP